jgi:hypothetical protein
MILADVHLAPGMLVTLPDRRGVATFVSAYGEQGTVFRSHSVQAFQRNKLGRGATDPASCGYAISENGWRIGRVKHQFIRINVCFPNDDAAAPAEDHLPGWVPETHADPSKVLARGDSKTHYLKDRRLAALVGTAGFHAALEGPTSAQGQLSNNLRERLGGGACL